MGKGRIKMLVADNDRDMCQVISDIFKEQGEEVAIAYDGESALRKLKTDRHDVMILDYKLAGISGLNVLEKASQISPSTIPIMISGYGNEAVRARAKELGAYAFLDKPFNIDRLVKLVQRAQASQVRGFRPASSPIKKAGVYDERGCLTWQ